jgi:hypothetical protein
MPANTREEVVAAVAAAFPHSDAATVLAVLDLYGVEAYERERERVQLAIVGLSGGSEDQLLYLVQAAKTDYRDVLAWQATGPLSPRQGEALQQAARALMAKWGKPGAG